MSRLPPPTTAADLQQFISAANWMRDHLPNFSAVFKPLLDALQVAFASSSSKKRSKRAAAKIPLQLSSSELEAFAAAKDLLQSAATLVYPDPEKVIHVFTDASSLAWGALITQVPVSDMSKPVEQRSHKPVSFLSGVFRGAALNWSIVDKECFALVATLQKFRHLLLAVLFYVFVDHRNLVYLFNPHRTCSVPTAARLERWGVILNGFNYVIEYIPGELNLCADMLSRQFTAEESCGPSIIRNLEAVRSPTVANQLSLARTSVPALVDPAILSRKRTSTSPTLPSPPLNTDDTVWPDLETIKASQQKYFVANGAKAQGTWNSTDELWKYESTRLVIPLEDELLITRLLILAHFSYSGHRGIKSTFQRLKRCFFWPKMMKSVEHFCSKCIHCLRAKTAASIPRPWGSRVKAKRRNEILHMDYLYMGDSVDGYKWLLVLKEGLSHFCRIIPAYSATSMVAVEALLQWFSLYGIVDLLVTDMGSHFINSVIKALLERLSVRHDIIPAGCSWINGLIERLNRDVLSVFRPLLAELGITHNDWPRLVPLVQSILNLGPEESLGWHSPTEIFTGLTATTPLDTIVRSDRDFATVALPIAELENLLLSLRASLRSMHEDVAQRTAERLNSNRNSQRHPLEFRFDLGDFVLVADVKRKERAKLLCQWLGPYRITAVTSPYIFTVESLVDNSTRVVHASRMQFYSDANLNVTRELVEHISMQGLSFQVDSIVDFRSVDGQIELLVSWRGFTDVESSWEPLLIMNTDVPQLVATFISSLPDDDALQLQSLLDAASLSGKRGV